MKATYELRCADCDFSETVDGGISGVYDVIDEHRADNLGHAVNFHVKELNEEEPQS